MIVVLLVKAIVKAMIMNEIIVVCEKMKKVRNVHNEKHGLRCPHH